MDVTQQQRPEQVALGHDGQPRQAGSLGPVASWTRPQDGSSCSKLAAWGLGLLLRLFLRGQSRCWQGWLCSYLGAVMHG